MKSIAKTNKNMVMGILSCFFSAIQSLWYIPYITHHLGSEIYGYIVVINGFVNVFSIVTLSITSMSTRYISIELQKNNFIKANSYFNTIFLSLSCISIGILCSSIVLACNLDVLMNFSKDFDFSLRVLCFLTFLCFIIQLISTPLISTFFFTNEIFIYYAFFAFDYVFRCILTKILFEHSNFGIFSIVLSDILVFSLAFCYYNWYRRQKVNVLKIDCHTYCKDNLFQIAKSGVWVSITKAGSVLISNLNSYYANLFCGLYITGVFATIQQFSTMIVMILTTLVNCFLPEMYRIYAKSTKIDLFNYTIYGMKIVGIIVGIITGAVVAFGKDFLTLWIGAEFAENFLILVLSVIYLPLVLPSELINQVAVTINKIKVPAIATVLFGGLNFALILFTQIYLNLGIMGVVLSNFLTLTLRSLLFFPFYLSGNLKIEISFAFYKPYFISMLICILTSFVGFICNFVVVQVNWEYFLLKSVITVTLSLVITMLIDKDLCSFMQGFWRRRGRIL